MDFNPVRFGKYLLLERINIGGMAEVFRAKTFGVEGFERIVAIKRILPNLVEDDEFVTMFIDEARIAVQLNHPNIAQIYELGKHGDHYYIAMEFLASRDLRLMLDRFKENGRMMPISQAAYIATKICEALDYAHRKKDPGGTPMNIIHRDVSPQNILISFDGEVKMIDFGIAKAANRASKTQVGVLKGKFAYMSPEQVRGLPIDRRSDVFAVGIVLYEMLTGERLFIAESDFSTLQRVRDAVVETPTSFNRNIPTELEQIVLKALARDVEDRYQWASELAEALQPFLIQGRTIYGPKKMAETIREDYAAEVAAERAKMDHFRTVGGQQDQFGGISEETEPQDSESYGLPVQTSHDDSIANDFDDGSDGETIIFEASRAGSILDRSLGQNEKAPEGTQPGPQDASMTAESDADDFQGSEDADATIVQMTSPFFRKQGPNTQPAPGVSTDVSDADDGSSQDQPAHDITGVDDPVKKTLPSAESDMATMAIPIEELRKGDERFQDFRKDDPAKLSVSGDNPSLTLPDNSEAENLVGSNESTAAAREPVQANAEAEDGFFTADTMGLSPEDAEALLPRGQAEIETQDFAKNLVGSGESHTQPVRAVADTVQGDVSVNAITASQSVASQDRPDLGQSIGSHTGSFAEFYGSRKSANPAIALLASWIRMVPKSFRAPVFMAVGAIFALLLVLMVVATQRVFNSPMGQIELQKVGELPVPPGIKIFLDDAIVGDKLPLRLTEVSPGKHVVRAEAPAPCENAEFEVTVSENQAAFIPIPIYCDEKAENRKSKAPEFSQWEVRVRAVDQKGRAVKNARVYIAGKKVGVTPFSTLIDRETASVDIRLEASGYATKRLTAAHNGIEKPPSIVVDLGTKKESATKPKVSTRKKPALDKPAQMATLELLVRPDATVYLNGKSTGRTTPLTGSRALNLSVGTHVIEFLVKRTSKKYKYRVKILEPSPENKIVIPKLGKNKIKQYGKLEVKPL